MDRQKLIEHCQHKNVTWEEYVSDKYARIQREIHEDSATKFGRIKFTEHPEKRSGLFSFLKHKKKGKTDFKQITDRIVNGFYKNTEVNSNDIEMLSSEFVSHCTIAALTKLNEELQNELNIDSNIVEIPIDPNEDLSRITPERFVKILKEKNCLEEIQVDEHLYGLDSKA